jgi:hypothetical protein
MRHINAQDGFYSHGLGRMIYNDDRPQMGFDFQDLINVGQKVGQGIISSNTDVLKTGDLSKIKLPSGELIKDQAMDYFSETGSGKEVTNVLTPLAVQYLPKGIAAQVSAVPNYVWYAMGAALVAYIAWKMTSGPNKSAVKAMVKEAMPDMAKPIVTPVAVMANPILSLMGYKNAHKKRSKRSKRKSRK